MPRRVVHFIWSLERGGAEGQLAALIRATDRARYAPELVVARGRDDFGVSREVPTRVISESEHFDLKSFGRLVTALRDIRPALVHSWMGSFNWYARLAAQLAPPTRVVGSVRVMQLSRADVFREAISQPLVHAIIVNSVGTRQELIARSKILSSKIEVIENGLDASRFAPLSPARRAASRLELGFTGRVLVMPARVCPQKNQLGVLEALEALSARGGLPKDLRVVFYGRLSDVSYAEEFRAGLRRPELRGRVELREPVSDLERVLSSADGLLMPSAYEGLPNAVIEALSCGTPAIVTPAANVDALVVDGRDGLVTQGPSSGAIADALERFCALGEHRLTELSRRARHEAAARFTIERMATATMAVYDRVLGDAP